MNNDSKSSTSKNLDIINNIKNKCINNNCIISKLFLLLIIELKLVFLYNND